MNKTMEELVELVVSGDSNSEEVIEASHIITCEVWNSMYENLCSKYNNPYSKLVDKLFAMCSYCDLHIEKSITGSCMKCPLNEVGQKCFNQGSHFMMYNKNKSETHIHAFKIAEIACDWEV